MVLPSWFNQNGNANAPTVNGVPGRSAGFGGLAYGNPKYDKLLQVQDIFEQLRQLNRTASANAFQAQRAGVESLEKGFNTALATTSRAGASARQGALDRGVQAQAAGEESLRSRGLGNTTALQNLTRAVGSDTNRALTEIDSVIAGLQSGLQAQKGQALAGGQSQLANLLLATSGREMDLGQSQIANILGAFQRKDSGASGLGGFAELLGAFSALSDRRAKTNLIALDNVDGITIYEYEYKKERGVRRIGVVAQEVLHTGATEMGDDEYLRVDYSRLPLAVRERIADLSGAMAVSA